MPTQEVLCPECETILVIPPGCCGRKVRCGQCGHKWRLPLRVNDDTVTSWLYEEEEGDKTVMGVSTGTGSAERVVGSASDTKVATATKAAPPAVLHSDDGTMRIVRIDRTGVLLEFPAKRMLNPDFRLAMPRRCLQCGTRAHLDAHVVLFSATLMDSISLETEHSTGTLLIPSYEAKALSPEDLLARLPRVPNAPPPADNPMPYWLCDMCTTSKAISGQIQVHSETGEGFCRLLIGNLRRAEEFLATVGARGTNGYAKLVDRIAKTAENPWDSLSLVVQHRIQGWFKPAREEQFIAYVPDRDRARTEEGVAGVLLSDQRLIYHSQMRHYELGAAQPVEFRLAMGSTDGELQIKTPGWEAKHLRVDRDGVARLRRGLVKGKFQANWR